MARPGVYIWPLTMEKVPCGAELDATEKQDASASRHAVALGLSPKKIIVRARWRSACPAMSLDGLFVGRGKSSEIRNGPLQPWQRE
jgi:hypothetical protein